MFASALVRRIAAVIVAGALAWVGIGRAGAQNFDLCFSDQETGAHPSDIRCPDRATAFAQADRIAAKRHIYPQRPRPPCTYSQNATVGWYYCEAPYNAVYSYGIGRGFLLVNQCPSGQVWNESASSCQKPCTSVARPPATVGRSPLSGSLGCNTGCVVNYANNGDDTSTVTVTGAMCGPDFKEKCPTGTFWNGYMALCQPIDPSCPKGQEKKDGVCVPEGQCPDGMIAVQASTPGAIQQGEMYCKKAESECPAGNIKSPTGQCLPGEGQCAAGEAKGKDGTCKRDSDGDGKPDEGEEEGNTDPTFSGGDSCEAPPACSGSPILCGQARIQWRIDCNTRKNRNVSGGSCDQVPVCTGEKCDAVEYSGLVMQWRTACATEKLAKKGAEDGSGDQPEWTKVSGDGTEGAGEEPKGPVHTVKVDITKRIDQGGFGGGGGQCPRLGVITLPLGVTFDLDSVPWACDLFTLLRHFMKLMGAAMAVAILLGKW